MMDFIVDKIVMPMLILLLFATVIGIPFLFMQHRQHEETLKICYMQEDRTKECEYVLWKYENRTKTRSAIVPMPVVVR